MLRSIDNRRRVDRAGAAVARRLLVGGIVCLLLVGVGDRLLSDRPLGEERPPDLSAPYLVRSLGLAVASVLVVVGARAVAQHRLPPTRRSSGPVSDELAASGGAVVAVAAVALLVIEPAALNTVAGEDHVAEWASALLCFSAAGLAVAAAVSYLRRPSGVGRARLLGALLVAFGAVFLLIGLEEVSWFQRVFDVAPPGTFVEGNAQEELNLHNFATDETETGYYVVGFVFCVALPFVLADRGLPPTIRFLEPLVPTTAVLYGTAVAGAIVYEMWNVMAIQLTFWATVPAVLLLATGAGKRRLGAVLALVMVGVLVAFLSLGDTMTRSWDDTEIRELVIPYGLTLYALQVWREARNQPQRALDDLHG